MTIRAATLVAISAFTGACIVGEDVPPSVDERVVMIESQDVVVGVDTLELARPGNEMLLALEPGQLVVARAGDGVLRGVGGVTQEGDRIVISTIPATLEDAVIAGHITGTLALSDGSGKADEFGLPRVDVEVTNVTLSDSDKLAVKIHKAGLHATPSIDLDVELADRSIESFEAILRGRLRAELDVELSAKQGTVRPKIPLWKSPPAVFTQWIGWFPVVETATITVGVRFDTTARGDASIRLRGATDISLAGGVRYTADGGFKAVQEYTQELDGQLVASANLDSIDVRMYLYTQVDVKFYGLAGPYVNVGPYLEESRIGLTGEVGGSLGAFGVNVPGIPKLTLFDVSRPY